MDVFLTNSKTDHYVRFSDIEGIKNFDKFLKIFVSRKYKQISVFRDGSWITSMKKLYNKKVRKLGRPILVIRPDIFEYVENDRLASIAEDINLDFSWLRKRDSESLLY